MSITRSTLVGPYVSCVSSWISSLIHNPSCAVCHHFDVTNTPPSDSFPSAAFSVRLVIPGLHVGRRPVRGERELRDHREPLRPVQLRPGQPGVGADLDFPISPASACVVLLCSISCVGRLDRVPDAPRHRCRLFCVPAPLADSTCSSMQCSNSSMMLGNFTLQMTSAGCSVTSCSYGGYVNGTILTT